MTALITGKEHAPPACVGAGPVSGFSIPALAASPGSTLQDLLAHVGSPVVNVLCLCAYAPDTIQQRTQPRPSDLRRDEESGLANRRSMLFKRLRWVLMCLGNCRRNPKQLETPNVITVHKTPVHAFARGVQMTGGWIGRNGATHQPSKKNIQNTQFFPIISTPRPFR